MQEFLERALCEAEFNADPLKYFNIQQPIETDGFNGVPEKKTLGLFSLLVENWDEVHFMFYCSVCEDFRAPLFAFFLEKYP